MALNLCRFSGIRICRISDTCFKCVRNHSISSIAYNKQRKYTFQSNVYRIRNYSSSVEGNVSTHLFPLQFIFVRTNVNLWAEFPEGVLFDVGYVDTQMRLNAISNKPVVLALPSTGGSHTELTSVLMTFAKLGYRVVIPNFPGTPFCCGRDKIDDAVFQMSVKEKAEFVTDFLKELHIDKVDMLITNSCSVYTGVELCLVNPSTIKSLVMINPTGLEPTKSMLPVWVHQRFTKLYDDRNVIHGFFKAVVAVVKCFTAKKDWNTVNVITYSRTIAVLSYEDEKLRAEYLQGRNFPCYAIFGETNDFFDVESTLEYLAIMGIPKSSITTIDAKNKIIKQGEPNKGKYGLHIQGSSGDIKKTTAPLLRKELLKIMKKICPEH